MTRPMTPLRAFSSILCVLLASVVGLVLSLIHPGWAVRLTRHVSRRMVGTSRKRRSGGVRRAQHWVPATKVNHETQTIAQTPVLAQARVADTQSQATRSPRVDPRVEVQSALTNLGMPRPIARKLAKQAVVGRDFDSALRWAIANGRAA